ncbi:hypothetical protein SeMB42_g07918 [Synchytrium endobioticum]|nr:hypothetical protein SeMB42_g07918 [Synchytrium endobioticum]
MQRDVDMAWENVELLTKAIPCEETLSLHLEMPSNFEGNLQLVISEIAKLKADMAAPDYSMDYVIATIYHIVEANPSPRTFLEIDRQLCQRASRDAVGPSAHRDIGSSSQGWGQGTSAHIESNPRKRDRTISNPRRDHPPAE